MRERSTNARIVSQFLHEKVAYPDTSSQFISKHVKNKHGDMNCHE